MERDGSLRSDTPPNPVGLIDVDKTFWVESEQYLYVTEYHSGNLDYQ